MTIKAPQRTRINQNVSSTEPVVLNRRIAGLYRVWLLDASTCGWDRLGDVGLRKRLSQQSKPVLSAELIRPEQCPARRAAGAAR